MGECGCKSKCKCKCKFEGEGRVRVQVPVRVQVQVAVRVPLHEPGLLESCIRICTCTRVSPSDSSWILFSKQRLRLLGLSRAHPVRLRARARNSAASGAT